MPCDKSDNKYLHGVLICTCRNKKFTQRRRADRAANLSGQAGRAANLSAQALDKRGPKRLKMCTNGGISLSAFPHFLKSNLWPILNMFSYLLQEICLDCILYGIIFFFFETYVYCKTHIKQNIYVFNVLLQSEEY